MKKVFFIAMSLAAALLFSTCSFVPEPDAPDYIRLMTAAVLAGDSLAGKTAEAQRNALIDESGSEELKVSYDELYLLSKYISSRAGSPENSSELRMCVGEVILNRVASPEFPDSLWEVILDAGGLPEGLRLSRPCVDAAMRLLLGERMMEPSVVYQTDRRSSLVYASYGDKRLGFIYFCRSENSELYG